ncbi:N-acetylglucosamine-6-phosphate deacetylase [Sphingomonas sp. HF-S3]|uniref:N-acetylglucosamine-6-phosphate deacetylase n=1 Tax=Sphingomonas rustica TaxID=3103142 RepID=A0ABV0B6F7_9SPHN
MKLRIANGGIVVGRAVFAAATIEVVDGRIAGLDPAISGSPDIDLDGGWLVPGFVDTQVNGGGGVLFNDDISVDGIAAIGAAHARFGTTAFLPTLISDTPEHVAAALDAADAAIAAGVPGVVGVHIEGPFINPAKRGIHEADRIRQLDPAMVELLSRPRAGRVVLTIAPERASLAHVQTLVSHGVIVCAGHTNATYDEVQSAVGAGLSGFTHLFNAMSPLTHRAPGAAGAALDAPGCWCGLIVDNAHLHPATVRIAIRAKGPDRIMLVTDAMPSVGTDATSFMLQGKRIEVHHGVCTYEDGTLAGSDLDMATAFRNTVQITGLAPAEVVRMSSEAPAAFLGLSATHGTLAPGRRADWVVLDRELRARGTWIGGRQIAEGAVGNSRRD